MYDLRAYSIDEFGAQSEPADPARMVVTEPGYITIGTFLVSFFSLLMPLIALLLVFVLGLIYLWRRMTKVIGFVSKETKEAEAVVTETFGRLNRTLDTHAKTLAASRKTKKLTQAESELIDALKKDLHEGERRVRKEVSEVDDII